MQLIGSTGIVRCATPTSTRTTTLRHLQAQISTSNRQFQGGLLSRIKLRPSGNHLLCTPARVFSAGNVDFFSLLRRICEDDYVVVCHLKHPAANGEGFFHATLAHPHLAEAESRNQRRVLWQDTHLSFNAAHVDDINFAIVQLAVLCNDLYS
jgi:hypothetical protein